MRQNIFCHLFRKSSFVLQNTDLNEAVSIEEVDSKTFITREGDFTRAGLEFVDEAEIFEGAENKITLTQTYSKRFHCTYLLHDFPFDTQVMKVIIYRVSQKKVYVRKSA